MKHHKHQKCSTKRKLLNSPPPKAAYISPAIYITATIPACPLQTSPQAYKTISRGEDLKDTQTWQAATKSSLWDCGFDEEDAVEGEDEEEI